MPMNFALPPLNVPPSFSDRLVGGPGLPPNSASKNQFMPVMLNGKNSAVSGLADIFGFNTVRALPTVAFTLAVISDSVADTAVGTGAQTVGVAYLDSSYNAHYATFTLNGQTAVTAPTTVDGLANTTPISNCLRVNQMDVLTAGTGFINAGNIYACDSTNTYASGVPVTAAKVFQQITTGDGIGSYAGYTVPAGCRFAIMGLLPSMDTITTTVAYAKLRYGQTFGANGIFQSFDLGQLTSTSALDQINPPHWPIAEAKSDIRFQAQASSASEISLLAWGIQWFS